MKQIKTPNRRAFTLTELLIVVIVIGVLSAVTLPKFNRVIENRKVTEAEEMMSAVRTEQERRCSLDQNYTMKFDNLSDVIASNHTKNYNYSLQNQGISAKSNSSDYTLKILSYQDGDFCCEGEGCEKLNKNYPKCGNMNPTISACVGNDGGDVGPEPDPVEPAECTDGQTSGTQVCNTCGTQTTQKCVGGKWTNSLGACSKTAEECAPTPPPTECNPGDTKDGGPCGNCNKGTLKYTCGADGKWGASGTCENNTACRPGAFHLKACPADELGENTNHIQEVCNDQCEWEQQGTCAQTCPSGKKWDGTACVCADQAAKAACTDKAGFVSIGSGDNVQLKKATIHYEWDDDACSCSCPSFGNDGLCSYSTGTMVKLGEWDSQTCNCKPQAVQPYYFKCVTRVVSSSGGMLATGSYTSKSAAEEACLSGKDPNAEFNAYLSGGTPVPGCRPYQDSKGNWVECAITPAYYIKWQCSTEPPRHASGYGFDEVMCVVICPHEPC